MKKSNLLTLIFLFIAVIGAIIFAACTSSESEKETSSEPSSTITDSSEALTSSSAIDISSETTSISSPAADMESALFIGDSRTVGLMEYSGLTEADFFCNSGMSVFNVRKERVSVPNIGKVTLDELLSNKKYSKIYLMLGINELGYKFESITANYGKLLDFIKSTQPDVKIFVQANLHVSADRSDSDSHINNAAINRLNLKLSEFADNSTIFYIDANPLFDDSLGNLSSDKTSDSAHLYAKHYSEWGEWIRTETANKLY